MQELGAGAVVPDGREPKVRDLQVVLAIEEEVLGLEVAVDDLVPVHVREDRDDLRGVRSDDVVDGELWLSVDDDQGAEYVPDECHEDNNILLFDGAICP